MLTIRGVYGREMYETWYKMTGLIEAGLDITPLITHQFPYSDFQQAFDGAICIDAMEHICPEDWPGILQRFHAALKPGGVLYLTVELAEPDEVEKAYQRA